MDVKRNVEIAGARAIFNFIEKDPEHNIQKVIDFSDTVLPPKVLDRQRAAMRKSLGNPDSNWYKLTLSIWKDIDPGVRKAAFENLVISSNIIGYPAEQNTRKKYDCNVPWALLMDPTSACNLHCVGCWAAEYGNKLNLSYDEMDSIVKQANELGTYVFLFTGGEPLVRKADIIKLCEAHPDSLFSAFTNGTLIDEAFADEMLRVKNFIPAISVEGFEEATDSRRGKGTFKKVEKAMSILKAKKLIFGLSCCYTRNNAEVIGSEAYFDQMVAWGAKFCWLFTYMPIGKAAAPELMTTAEQREFMYHQVRKFRDTKPIFTMDFWNDGEYVGGCIAGGKSYLHINANGDVEPCAFIHYSDANIRTSTLLDALRGPLFTAYHKNQPFNPNMLRPCPVLDNPGRLTKIVEETNAKNTDYQAQESAREYSEKCVDTAKKWAPVANKLWDETKARKAAEAEKAR